MNISLIGSVLFMIAEGVMAFWTRSHSILMDCIFDLTDLIMIGPFLLLVPLLYKPVTERRTYGFAPVSYTHLMPVVMLLPVLLRLFWQWEPVKLLQRVFMNSWASNTYKWVCCHVRPWTANGEIVLTNKSDIGLSEERTLPAVFFTLINNWNCCCVVCDHRTKYLKVRIYRDFLGF